MKIRYEICGSDTFTVLLIGNIYSWIEYGKNPTIAWENAWILHDKANHPLTATQPPLATDDTSAQLLKPPYRIANA